MAADFVVQLDCLKLEVVVKMFEAAQVLARAAKTLIDEVNEHPYSTPDVDGLEAALDAFAGYFTDAIESSE